MTAQKLCLRTFMNQETATLMRHTDRHVDALLSNVRHGMLVEYVGVSRNPAANCTMRGMIFQI